MGLVSVHMCMCRVISAAATGALVRREASPFFFSLLLSSRKASDASLQIRCVILIAEIDALLMLLMGFPTRSTDTALNVMI